MDPVLYYLEEVPELITTQRFPEWWGSQVSEPPVIKLRGKSMLGRSALSHRSSERTSRAHVGAGKVSWKK